MPDSSGNFRGVSLSGRAGEAWERIFVVDLPEPRAGACAEALEREMHGTLEDGWYAFLRGTMPWNTPDAELRAKARQLADAGESLPRFGDDD